MSNLDQFIRQLPHTAPQDLDTLFAQSQLTLADFAPFNFSQPNQYTRNCIVRNEHFELLLLNWAPNSKAPIHDHNGEECWFFLLDGSLEEEIFHLKNNRPIALKKHVLNRHSHSHLPNPNWLHRVVNNSNSTAVSLHYYSSPIEQCRVYDEKNARFKWHKSQYYSVAGKVLKHEPVTAKLF
ncbi:hypothetical protein GC194_04710 [bacterium]|nr:hypothetical protein [bacterium]